MIRIITFLLLFNIAFAGFTDEFNKYPNRMKIVNTPEMLKLLEKFKPRVYVSKNSYLPISFYEDYLPNTVLKKSGLINKKIDEKVTANELKNNSKKKEYFLDYKLPYKKAKNMKIDEVNPTLYGRVYSDSLKSEFGKMDLIFLKYNFCFPYSGLPKDLKTLQKIGSSFIASRYSWHELDIHGAVHIILNSNNQEVVGVLVNQHNHHKSYVRNLDFTMPNDNRVEIVIAEYSNEPYLYLDKKGSYEKTAGLPKDLDYMYGDSDDGGALAARDYLPAIDETIEVEMKVDVLPEGDPLYDAEMLLGNKPKLMGLIDLWYLNGPPGMDYYSFPELKNLADLFSFWYIKAGEDDLYKLWEESFKSFEEIDLTVMKARQNNSMYNRIINLK